MIVERTIGPDVGKHAFVGRGGTQGGHIGGEKGRSDKGLVGQGGYATGDHAAAANGLIGLGEIADHDVAGEIGALGAGEVILVLHGQRVGHEGGGGAGLVVVIDEIDLHRAAIGGAAAPVVDDVVGDIEAAGEGVGGIETAAEGPVAALVVSEQIVVKTSFVTADRGGITVGGAGGIVLVAGDVQGLGNEGVLQGDVLRTAGAKTLVDGPADGRMVHDGVVAAGEAATVDGLAADVAGAVAEEADHSVFGAAETEGPLTQADAFTGRGLAGDGDIGRGKGEAMIYRDQTTDIENDHARPGLNFHRVAKGARDRRISGAVVGERSHMDDATTATAAGEATVALGSREGEVPRAEIPDGAGGDVAQGIDLIDAPVVGGVRISDGNGTGETGLVSEVCGGGPRGGFDRRQVGAEINVMGDGGAGGGGGPRKGNREGVRVHVLIGVGGHGGVGDAGGVGGVDLEAVQNHVLGVRGGGGVSCE